MSAKTKRNQKCSCGSGKKYKKCCLNNPITDEMSKHASMAGNVYNFFTKTDVEQNIFNWAKTVNVNGHLIAATNIEPYTPIEIYPVHFINIKGRRISCFETNDSSNNSGDMILRTNASFTDFEDSNISVSANKDICLENQCGHLIEKDPSGNTCVYHFGMYVIFFVSNRFIRLGETIRWTSNGWMSVISRFVENNKESMGRFNTYYVKSVNEMLRIERSSVFWSDEKRETMKKLYEQINKKYNE